LLLLLLCLLLSLLNGDSVQEIVNLLSLFVMLVVVVMMGQSGSVNGDLRRNVNSNHDRLHGHFDAGTFRMEAMTSCGSCSLLRLLLLLP